MSVPEDRSESRQSDLAVMDAQEYKQKRRLRRILDAREAVEEINQEAFKGFIAGDLSADALNVSLLRAVQSYIRETYTLLMEWREEQDYGEDELDPYWTGKPSERDPLGSIQFDHREPVMFWGLRGVLVAQDFYEETWTEEVDNRHGPDTVEQKSQQYSVPENVSQNAYLRVNEFLSEEKDLELQFEDMDDSRPFQDWRENVDGVYDAPE